MTIKQWYETIGESLISAEGRGEAGFARIGDNAFTVVLSDIDLSRPPAKPGESKPEYLARVESEDTESIFRGEDDVMRAVNWFLDQVAYSTQDREDILKRWKEQSG